MVARWPLADDGAHTPRPLVASAHDVAGSSTRRHRPRRRLRRTRRVIRRRQPARFLGTAGRGPECYLAVRLRNPEALLQQLPRVRNSRRGADDRQVSVRRLRRPRRHDAARVCATEAQQSPALPLWRTGELAATRMAEVGAMTWRPEREPVPPALVQAGISAAHEIATRSADQREILVDALMRTAWPSLGHKTVAAVNGCREDGQTLTLSILYSGALDHLGAPSSYSRWRSSMRRIFPVSVLGDPRRTRSCADRRRRTAARGRSALISSASSSPAACPRRARRTP